MPARLHRPASNRFGARSGLLSLCLVLGACSERGPVPAAPAPPSQIVEGFHLLESDAGERLYDLVATRAYVYDADHRILVDQPRITFYDDAGRPFTRLRARRGVVYDRSSDLVAYDSVEVVTDDSTRVFTDSLAWSNSKRVAATDAAVRIVSPQGEFTGRGLVSDAEFARITIKEEIRGTSPYRFQR